MRTSLKNAWQRTKAAVALWIDRSAARLGAAVAFYSIFSLAPLLVIAVTLAGAFLGFAPAERIYQLRGTA